MTTREYIKKQAKTILTEYVSAPTPQEQLIKRLRAEAGSPALFSILTEYFLLAAFKNGTLPWSQGLLKYYHKNPLKDFDDRVSYEGAPAVNIDQDVFEAGEDLSLHPGLLLCILDVLGLKKSTNTYVSWLVQRDLEAGEAEGFGEEQPDFLATLFAELPEKEEGRIHEFDPKKYLTAITR